MAEVRIDDVTKVYPGDVLAVDQLTLPIQDEEFIVLVGPSGCGKSTTLRMVAGLEDISDGTIRIGDRIVNDVPPKDREIAMVFQNYALYPHMTVYKNMAFGLKLRRFPKAEIERRVRDAARILGIEDLLGRKPKALSGGQRQRVAVGRAIVRDPACFLFDEPLSNLDAKLRVETRAELKRLHHRLKTTTIYVTHDQEEAMTLGDRVVVMDLGLLQQCAAPLTIYNAPINKFVAGFVGTPPMNFVDGRLIGNSGQTFFKGDGLHVRLSASQAEAAQEYVDQEVVMGIRPEAMFLRPNENANADDQSLQTRVGVVEPLGSMMDVFLYTSEEKDMVARISAEPIDASSTLTMYLDMNKTHFFELGTYGRNITLSQPTAATS